MLCPGLYLAAQTVQLIHYAPSVQYVKLYPAIQVLVYLCRFSLALVESVFTQERVSWIKE